MTFGIRRAEDVQRRGENFQVVELNGAASEATNIYDARNSLGRPTGRCSHNGGSSFAIGAANRARGSRPVSFATLWREWRKYVEAASSYPDRGLNVHRLLSFQPRTGFRLAMNRDEKRTRVAALPPDVFARRSRRAIYPREPNDGTWLAVNDAGLCLALINWHQVKRESKGKIESRGFIIPRLIGASNGRAVDRVLRKLELDWVRPFRLIAIDSSWKEVTEWQWNLQALKGRRHSWRTQHWFSSGYDEREAERQREKVCSGSSLGKSSSLKKLHSSHLPKRGPFSICMHRSDAATVSYSEVVVGEKRITFRYQSGPPCRDRGRVARSLSL